MLLKSNVLSNECGSWFKTLNDTHLSSAHRATSTPATEVGRLIILSGPSGAGKSTVVRKLLEEADLPLELSVSATTRSPRPGEIDGVDYHFVSPEEFQQRRQRGDFLEFKEVFGRGYWYGTLRDEVASGLNRGKWVILEIDVQGALSVLHHLPDCITIFLYPGDMGELERRLRARGTETEAAIKRRLEVARQEWDLRQHYRHHVLNESVTDAVRRIREILQAYRGPDACSKS